MIFIKGHVPSSKNSKNWTGRFLVNSKQTQTYIKETKQDYLQNLAIFLNQAKKQQFPLKIAFHFVRKSKHKYDFHNAVQTVTDLMVKYGYIEDDNVSIMFPFPLDIDGSYTSYDKDNPGVYIDIL